MLSLLKKKSDAAAAPMVPSWHPNFRNYEKLPDIKVVRTAFFVNGAAIFVALALGIYFATKEWQLRVVKSQVAEVQRQIDVNKKPSDQAVALFKKFQTEEAKIIEVDTFVKSKPLVSSIVLRLSETLPKNVALESITLRVDSLALRFSVRGDSASASGYATAYLEQLRGDKQLDHFDEISFASTPTRNPTTGRMAVEFVLRLKPPAPAPGGKK